MALRLTTKTMQEFALLESLKGKKNVFSQLHMSTSGNYQVQKIVWLAICLVKFLYTIAV